MKIKQRKRYETPNIWVRHATAEDLAACIQIWRKAALWLGTPSHSSLKSALKTDTLYVAEICGEVVGFVEFYRKKDGEATVYHIGVHQSYLRRGVAKFLLGAINPPIQLKVTYSNLGAISFYEKLHFYPIGASQTPKGVDLLHFRLDRHFIQVAGNNTKFPQICRDAGILYGTRHDDYAVDQPFMLDIKWDNYHWPDYQDKVLAYRPVYALAADYEFPEQKETMLSQLTWLKEQGVMHTLCAPKFAGAIADIPKEIIIAVSVPSRYAGFLPDPAELVGRRVHLLGGGLRKQEKVLDSYEAQGIRVVSIDGNAHTNSLYGEFNGERWHFPQPRDNYKRIENSARNIASLFQSRFEVMKEKV